MFFALLDYINYRAKRGLYSRASIERDGGRLADMELYPLLKDCRPLDIMIYHRSNSFPSWLVMYFTKSVWSHVASFGENGYLYDMTTQGLIKHHFSDYLDGNGYMIVKRPIKPLTNENVQKAIRFSESIIGAPYAWKDVIYKGLRIVTGRSSSYHYRISLDFLIFCALFLPVGFLIPFFAYADVAVMTLYCGIVLASRPQRVAEAKALAKWIGGQA